MLYIDNNPVFYKNNNFYIKSLKSDTETKFYPTIVSGQYLLTDISYGYADGRIFHCCDDIYSRQWKQTEYREANDGFDEHVYNNNATDVLNMFCGTTKPSSRSVIDVMYALISVADMECCTAEREYHRTGGTFFCNSQHITPIIFHYYGSWYIAHSHKDYYQYNYSRILSFKNEMSVATTPLTEIISLL